MKRLNADDGVVGLGGHPCGLFGSARFLLGFLDQPEVRVAALYIWEDMSYKNGPLISPELLGGGLRARCGRR